MSSLFAQLYHLKQFRVECGNHHTFVPMMVMIGATGRLQDQEVRGTQSGPQPGEAAAQDFEGLELAGRLRATDSSDEDGVSNG